MIKTALKHWIYELCIEKIFSSIKENFIGKAPLKEISGLKMWDKFEYIEFQNGDASTARIMDCVINGFIGLRLMIHYEESWLIAINPDGGKGYVYDINSHGGEVTVDIHDIIDYKEK